LADRFVFEAALIDYGPVLLLKPFRLHLTMDALSCSACAEPSEALPPLLDMVPSIREPEGL
jgi:hypothetical protein